MTTHGLERFDQEIPADHECGPDCERPAGFYIATVFTGPAENQFDTKAYIHNMHARDVISAMIQMMDSTFQDNKPDDVPAPIAFARGRDLFKSMLELAGPPGQVSADVSALIDMFNREFGEGDE